MKRTKIVCTLGPSSSSAEMITKLAEAGMDVARLNFSHGDHQSHGRTIRTIRQVSKKIGREIGILQDLCGPKIRLGKIDEGEIYLYSGQQIKLSGGKEQEGVLPVTYPFLADDLKVEDRILLADGLVELIVEKIEDELVYCKVINEGSVSTGKGVNLPLSSLRISTFTEKDRKDFAFGLDAGVDFVAMSFVRHENDLNPLHEMIDQTESRPLIIAKIEKPEAVERLDHILEKVDGIMVARGDLGVEMSLEKVPAIQKEIIDKSRRAAKPVITATQMLRSMVDNPRPTRAEAADAANAVLDGTDAVMLSDETAIGKYPIEAVKILNRICQSTEPHINDTVFLKQEASRLVPSSEAAFSRAATWLAKDIKPKAIIASTFSGSTARLLSRLRTSYPIIGLTPELLTCRQLTLSWGVIPVLIGAYDDIDQMFDLAREWFINNNLGQPGDHLIITAGVPVNVPGNTNLMQVLTL